jgi:predicted PurR-regulated permease PerM
MIVISTWPIMLSVQVRLWGNRACAVAVMTLSLLLMLILPISLAGGIVFINSEGILNWIQSLSTLTLAPLPEWVGTLPVIGKKITRQWQHVMAMGPKEISAFLTPYASKILNWFAALSGSIGMMVIQSLLTVFIAAIFYQRGDKAADWLLLFARRIAGHYGENALTLAVSAIRAVALGVVGTAIIQTVLAGLGLAVCGVPAMTILLAIIFILELAQVGPMPVLIPAVIWLFWRDQIMLGTVLAAWTLFLSVFDNIVTPFLMKKGADLPMLLVFAGVTGGMMVFGVIGLFIGPVVLAVTHTLLDAWVTGDMTAEKESLLEQ